MSNAQAKINRVVATMHANAVARLQEAALELKSARDRVHKLEQVEFEAMVEINELAAWLRAHAPGVADPVAETDAVATFERAIAPAL